jgi:hypothetical protein
MSAVGRFRLSGPTGEHQLISDAGNVVTRTFCPQCGSPIFGRNSGMDGFVTISLGTFDDSSMFEPAVVVFAHNRRPWDVMDSSLPTFEAQPAWHPEDGS